MVVYFTRLCSVPSLNQAHPFQVSLKTVHYPTMLPAKPHTLKLKWLLSQHWIVCDSQSVNTQGTETIAVKKWGFPALKHPV